jgi:ribosome biogenesis GTPase A
MAIDWYPGHMVGARRDAAEAMAKTDVVIEVLDARLPLSSSNPAVEALRLKHGRPALKVLNKVDIADPSKTKAWLDHYNAKEGTRAIAVSAKKSGDAARIIKECPALTASSSSRARPLSLMILGVPNVGKSTLMNAILKRHIAKVGDEPAITKMHARHQLPNGMWLIDTPGLMWPRMAEKVGLKLAAANIIGKNAYDEAEVAMFLGAYLLEHYPTALVHRYGAIEATDGHTLMLAIAKVKSLVIKGGAPDFTKASVMLLNDFRSGALGAITLDDVVLA